MVDCGVGIKLDGNIHLNVRNLQGATTRSLFELSGGATVDAVNVTHHAQPAPDKPNAKPKRLRDKR